MGKPTSPRARHDFDGVWKEALYLFLQPCLALLAPAIHDAVDWTRDVAFLDKELQAVGIRTSGGRGTVDCLVKVYLVNGGEAWILIHVEVQNQVDRALPLRVFIYYSRLVDKYRVPVVSVAILGDDDANWRPDAWRADILGCSAGIQFPTIKLLDWRARTHLLEESRNPFAGVVLGHLDALATRHDPAERERRKFARIRWLYTQGHTAETVRAVYRFLDWLLKLPAAAEERVWSAVRTLEEEQQMPYVTTAERIGRREGRRQGRQEGRQEGLSEGRVAGLRDGLRVALELAHGADGAALGQRLDRVADEATLKRFEERLRARAGLAELTAIVELVGT